MSVSATLPDLTVRRKPHLDGLDRLRIITALSVVGVHVLGNTIFLDRTSTDLVAQDGAVTALHFTREIFMFVTALALVYVYSGKPLDTGRFWRRRAVGVLLPYAAWTVIFQVTSTRSPTVLAFLRTLAINLLTGNASYQLYYILLTIEFYVLFPWFLHILPLLARRPWISLGVSFALEVAILFALHDVLPKLPLSSAMVGNITLFFNRFALTYQLYFVMGGLAALNIGRIKAFLLRYGAWMIGVGALGLAILEGHYLVDTLVRNIAPGAVITVLQPAMAPYSVGAIAFLYWLTLWQAERVQRRDGQRTRRVWFALSDSAFGVYLVHPLILTAVLGSIVPHFTGWPVAATVALVWLLTAAGSVAVTLLLLRIPVVSRLVGRERPAPEWLRRGWSPVAGGGRAALAASVSSLRAQLWSKAVQRKEVTGESD